MKSGGIARHLHLIPNFLSHALRQNKQDAMSAIRPLLARVCLSKIKFNSLWLLQGVKNRAIITTKSKCKMKQSTFKILFYLRSNHINKDSTSAIIVRVSIDWKTQARMTP